MRSLLAIIATVAVCASASAAAGPSVNLMQTFKTELVKIKRATTVPVLLPGSLPILDKLKVYGTGGPNAKGWDLELAFAPNCGSATACFLADFSGERGGKLPGKSNVQLGSGDPAYYHPSTCGASCAPASLWFIHAGVLYSWQDSNVTQKSAKSLLVGLADQAILAGPR